MPIARFGSRATRSLLLAFLVLATSCGESATGSDPVTEPATVARVDVTAPADRVSLGDTVQLTATPRDAAGNAVTGRATQWTSDNPAVVRVDAGSGRATAAAVGSATITATTDGKSGQMTLSVAAQPIASLVLSPDTATLVVGGSIQPRAIARDRRGTVLEGRAVAWSSSADGVARVDAAGTITAVAPGTATITATSEGQSTTARIAVVPVPVARVTIRPDTATIAVGGTLPIVVTALDAAGNALPGREVMLVSSNAAVATLSGNTLRAVAPGPVVVTATVEGKTVSTGTIRVVSVAIDRITIAPNGGTLEVGSSRDLAVTAYDAAGNALVGRTVTLTTSDASFVSLTGSRVNAVAPGTAAITATAEGKSATVYFTVVPVPIATLTISPDSASLRAGESLTVVVTARDAAGNVLAGRPVILTSSNEAVAAVFVWGAVSGVAEGTATITARAEGKTATAKIVVGPRAVASVALSPAGTTTLEIGASRDFNATAYDANGGVLTGRAVSWSSSSPGIASVSGTGVVTAVAQGSATITATVEGRSGTASVVVNGASDATPPKLTGFSFTPSSVNVTNGAAAIDVTFSATDVGAGVSAVEARIVSPEIGTNTRQGQSCMARQLTSGTAANGVWRCTITVPQASAAGTWFVSIVTVFDRIGNFTRLEEADLNAAGYATKIRVESAGDDATPPSLTGFSFTPADIDVTNGPANIAVTFAARDVGTGVSSVEATIVSPVVGTNTRQSQSCTARQLTSGTTANGVWRCTITVPRGSAAGTWIVSTVFVIDSIGNFTRLETGDLNAAGYATTVRVTSGNGDATPPRLTGFSFTPSSVNVTNGSAAIDVTFSATDVGTGVSSVEANIVSPEIGTNTRQSQSCMARQLTSGTTANGVWRCTITIPQGSAAGTWIVSTVFVIDGIDNFTRLETGDLNAAGYATTIRVQS